jgi:lipopolysaccharide biosynthesis regulator YciM
LIDSHSIQEPDCVKAHFRKAKAHHSIWEYEQAIDAYQMVLKFEPGQVPATAGLAECRQARKKAHNDERGKFKGMFGKHD